MLNPLLSGAHTVCEGKLLHRHSRGSVAGRLKAIDDRAERVPCVDTAHGRTSMEGEVANRHTLNNPAVTFTGVQGDCIITRKYVTVADRTVLGRAVQVDAVVEDFCRVAGKAIDVEAGRCCQGRG